MLNQRRIYGFDTTFYLRRVAAGTTKVLSCTESAYQVECLVLVLVSLDAVICGPWL